MKKNGLLWKMLVRCSCLWQVDDMLKVMSSSTLMNHSIGVVVGMIMEVQVRVVYMDGIPVLVGIMVTLSVSFKTTNSLILKAERESSPSWLFLKLKMK